MKINLGFRSDSLNRALYGGYESAAANADATHRAVDQATVCMTATYLLLIVRNPSLVANQGMYNDAKALLDRFCSKVEILEEPSIILADRVPTKPLPRMI